MRKNQGRRGVSNARYSFRSLLRNNRAYPPEAIGWYRVNPTIVSSFAWHLPVFSERKGEWAHGSMEKVQPAREKQKARRQNEYEIALYILPRHRKGNGRRGSFESSVSEATGGANQNRSLPAPPLNLEPFRGSQFKSGLRRRGVQSTRIPLDPSIARPPTKPTRTRR